MSTKGMSFVPVRASLADIIGVEVVEAAVGARCALTGEPAALLRREATRRVDFLPQTMQRRLSALLPSIGQVVTRPAATSARGATSRGFEAASNTANAPLSGYGYYRVGEDGRLRFISKSEHYHTPLGHAFPGYGLIDIARRLGIGNATHNNTRGHITRLLEQELVRSANGIAADDAGGLRRLLGSRKPTALNRVLNMETGSLAVEAALKMMLARFYRVQSDSPPPPHQGRTPVFVVLGNSDGELTANYHGTTVLAQTLRGMWPELRHTMEQRRLYRVVAVRPNNRDDLDAVFARYTRGPYRIAGFLHEIVMMNYGALTLTRGFLRQAYSLCRQHDVPTLVDEIQSCVWSPETFMFREYGLKPMAVAVGKGFPGGEYPASRLLFSSQLDCLPQFGALVTNGQEELASLAYLVTLRWLAANHEVVRMLGDYYEAALRALPARYPGTVECIEGSRHMSSIYFHDLPKAVAFVGDMVAGGLDISVQNYKANCPPSALTKIPIIAGRDALDTVMQHITHALERR